MTGFLTDAELTAMRSVVLNILPDTCTLLAGTLSSDGMGGGTMGWGTTATSVACKLARQNYGAVGVIGGAIAYADGWVLHIAYNGTIGVGQRAVLTAGTYSIEAVQEDHSWRLLKNCRVRQVT